MCPLTVRGLIGHIKSFLKCSHVRNVKVVNAGVFPLCDLPTADHFFFFFDSLFPHHLEQRQLTHTAAVLSICVG